MQEDVWTSREGVAALADEMVGFKVEARDGSIGKVDRVSYTGTCIFVSTGLIRGRKYVIPASAVERIDVDDEKIFVDLTSEQVENSPEYDDDLGFDDDCEAKTGAYYTDLLAERASPK